MWVLLTTMTKFATWACVFAFLSEPIKDHFILELSALYHLFVVEYFKECGTLFMLVPGFLGLLVRPVELPV